MTTVKHAKQSGLPADDGDSGHVRPSDWYADHTIEGALGGGLLGLNDYSASNYTNPTTSLADVDATNMKVTFVAPPSGQVLVRLSAYVDGNTGGVMWWNLRNGSTAVTTEKGATRGDYDGSPPYEFIDNGGHRSVPFLITGLTPGTSYTYKWAWRAANSGSDQRILSGGVMEVWDAGTADATSGVAFPSSPATGRRFFREDLGAEFRFDGTYWLSTQLFSFEVAVEALSATGGSIRYPLPSDAYVVELTTTTYVAGTNNGSNYWTAVVSKSTYGNADTTIGSTTTSADSGSVFVRHTSAIGVLIDVATYYGFTTQFVKTGSPGVLYGGMVVWYRRRAS